MTIRTRDLENTLKFQIVNNKFNNEKKTGGGGKHQPSLGVVQLLDFVLKTESFLIESAVGQFETSI